MFRAIGHRAAAFSRRTTEPDDFAASLLGGQFEYLPVHGTTFDATLRILMLGDLVVQHGTDSAHITRGVVQPGLAGLIVPLRRQGGGATANGAAVVGRDAILVPGGTDFAVSCPAPQNWGSVALPAEMLAELAELAPAPVCVPGGLSLVTLSAAASERLVAAFDAARRLVDEAPAALQVPGCAEGLAMSLVEMVAGALAPGTAVTPQRRATREAMRVLRSAEDFLRQHLARPVYRDELCAALGVSRRKLHDAFVATVGMSPAAYLKLRRLALARRALRQAGPGQTLVKSVALSHGFWHLGYFAKDYREMFGETPSETAFGMAVRRGPAGAVGRMLELARSG
ncbi:helix-turn-helix domain-containing protein [Falsiroseomonas oryzae]|uniref:helix-turn-helix domain-containing protein n=1 Tax=Falsiroseomonas oryzae TaxID=2766473 RepID=UPI0022EA9E85|nr:helix-turn-helix domain-containing protein [Roseomonas sp. MO-31]